MVVVADTAPLHYLVQIGYDALLPQLFAEVLIPPAVWQELHEENTPAVVQRWVEQIPAWLRVGSLQAPPDQSLASLDAGEREAIQLAHEVGAILLLIDERAGARMAREQGLLVTGTLGLLLDAAQQGLLPLEEALGRLATTNFRRTSQLFHQVRELARQRGIAL
jgi:predicted nucleic acid-binding protein